MCVVGFYIFPGFVGRSTHGSSLPVCSLARLPVNSDPRAQPRAWGLGRVVIFPGDLDWIRFLKSYWGLARPCYKYGL